MFCKVRQKVFDANKAQYCQYSALHALLNDLV